MTEVAGLWIMRLSSCSLGLKACQLCGEKVKIKAIVKIKAALAYVINSVPRRLATQRWHQLFDPLCFSPC